MFLYLQYPVIFTTNVKILKKNMLFLLLWPSYTQKH